MAGVLNSSQMLVSGNRQRNSTIPSHVPTASRSVPSRPMRPSFRTRVSSATPSTEPKPDPFATKEVYSDSDPISKFSIWYFSKVMSENLGNKPFDGTYDSFVELSREIMRGRSTKQQQETVASVLGNLLPPQSPQRFRQWFPLSRRTAEFNAWITTLGFTWLVGPSELTEVEIEFEGKKQVWKSGVKIKKCRYLENSGCTGMCINMCKVPTQKFFTETFGLPLTMNPDFETLECEMIFGQEPPPIEQDDVYNQPCLSVCNLARLSDTVGGGNKAPPACPKTDTDRTAAMAKKLNAAAAASSSSSATSA